VGIVIVGSDPFKRRMAVGALAFVLAIITATAPHPCKSFVFTVDAHVPVLTIAILPANAAQFVIAVQPRMGAARKKLAFMGVNEGAGPKLAVPITLIMFPEITGSTKAWGVLK